MFTSARLLNKSTVSTILSRNVSIRDVWTFPPIHSAKDIDILVCMFSASENPVHSPGLIVFMLMLVMTPSVNSRFTLSATLHSIKTEVLLLNQAVIISSEEQWPRGTRDYELSQSLIFPNSIREHTFQTSPVSRADSIFIFWKKSHWKIINQLPNINRKLWTEILN